MDRHAYYKKAATLDVFGSADPVPSHVGREPSRSSGIAMDAFSLGIWPPALQNVRPRAARLGRDCLSSYGDNL